MSKKKIGVLLGVVVVIAAIGGTGYYFRNEIKEMIPFLQDGSPADKVYVQKVSRVMNQYSGVSNRYNGTVESQETYEVNVDTSRTIDKILVEEGDLVEEGQTIVTYDTSDLKMQIQQINLEIESINNDIDNYNKQIDMTAKEAEKLPVEERFTYETEIQSLRNSISQKQFDLESKKLEITKNQTQINNSSLISKVSGVVKEINEKGTDEYGNAAPFMTILQTGDYRIAGKIDEQNIWTLSEGQQVLVRSRVDASQTWNGVISLIDTENPVQGGNNNYYSSSGDMQAASKYPFYIELDSVDGLILGQHVYIELDLGQEETKEGLWLYGSYIVQDDGEPYVWAANDKERLEKRYVTLGEYDEEMDEYEILSGLTVSDYITWPMPGLYEGVTTVTDEAEVDYSSPLYNQEPDGMDDGELYDVDPGMMYDETGTEWMYDMEGTEWMDEPGMMNDMGESGMMNDMGESDVMNDMDEDGMADDADGADAESGMPMTDDGEAEVAE